MPDQSLTAAGAAPPDSSRAPSSAFHRAVAVGAGAALQRSGAEVLRCVVAGKILELTFAGPALTSMMTKALHHLELAAPNVVPDLAITIVDSQSTAVPRPVLPWQSSQVGVRGEILGFDGPSHCTAWEPGIDMLQVYDRVQRRGVVWVASSETMPWWEPTFPFRQMLQWWSESTNLQPTHAGAVSVDGRGVLIAGASGAGKSTTTLTGFAHGMDYLGDDYILVDVENFAMHALYATAKVLPQTLTRLPWLSSHVGNHDLMHEQKAVGLLPPASVTRHADLYAVVIPTVVSSSSSRLRLVSQGRALRALAPSTMFQLCADRRLVMDKMSRLTRAVPTYILEAGRDVAGVAASLKEALS